VWCILRQIVAFLEYNLFDTNGSCFKKGQQGAYEMIKSIFLDDSRVHLGDIIPRAEVAY
jgi:hypothetical protein